MNKDYYKILGLSTVASGDDIKKAYHKLAKRYHPDSNGGDLDAAELFKEVNEAYHILSDEEKRNYYDLQKNTGFAFLKVDFQPYFIVALDTDSVKLNEEFEVTYRYTGEGRVFKRPESGSLFYNSSPVINHRQVNAINGEVKETSMTFTMSVLETGAITIPPATIYINHKLFQSEQQTIVVTSNTCYFKPGEEASAWPFTLHLHKEQLGKTIYRRTYIYRHTVLIPRSNYAYYYHQIGTTLKIVFMLLGVLYTIAGAHSIVTGFLAGELCGGIACHSMYKLTGVRSKFYHALQHATVGNYMDAGYKPGREVGYWIFDDKVFYLFISLFR